MTHQEAKGILKALDLVFDPDDELEHYDQTLNMNDVWGWALSWCEYIPNEELPKVGVLAQTYGYCGVLYWMSERHNHMKSEFHDINRFVEFVRQEEVIRLAEPNSSKRAYNKVNYTLGLV